MAGGVDVVAASRELTAEVRARADEIEATRHLPADLSAAFARAGLYRTCVPEVYGGLELPPSVTAQAIETLATADGSAAWCVFIGGTSGTVLALLPAETARDVFASPETLICGVFAPRGEARPEPGGFRVNGRWQWGSGTENADWILGGSRIVDADPPRAHMMLAPRADVHLLDTWHVSGLCGTGSTDFEMRDLFVPEERVVGLRVRKPLERPLFAFPQFGLLGMGIAAVTLGLARAAIDALVDLAGGKQPEGSRRTLAQRGNAQSDVATAEAELRSARAFYYEALDAAWEEAVAEGRISVERKRDVRLATSWATRASARAVDRMYTLAGGSSVYRSSPLQRIFRDVHVATQHMMVGPATLELTGRLLLGVETDTSQL